MKKYLTQFLHYGKLVDKDGTEYENLENPKYGEELDTIRVVRYHGAGRYWELLRLSRRSDYEFSDEEKQKWKVMF